MDNRAFWNKRYEENPWLGSGPGSRGIGQFYKAQLLRDCVMKGGVTSIVDVGCGDMCWLGTRLLSVNDLRGIRFKGLDISDVVVRRNRTAFPELEFEVFDLGKEPLGEKADLVLCFDVLLHQTSLEGFKRCLEHLLAGIGARALMSYRNANFPQEAIMPDLMGFDHGVERRFRRALATWQAQNGERRHGRFATTAYFGELSKWIHELSGSYGVTHVGDYNFQSAYRVTRVGSR